MKAGNSQQRSLLRAVILFLYHLLAKVEVVGLENMPLQGGVIVAVNHLSRLDPPLVFALVERSDLTAIVADKYKRYPLIGWLVNRVQGIWIKREEADFQALREARQYLRNGGALGIAPEGTRSTERSLLPAKTGVAYLADKAEVPIVPVAVSGTEKAFPQLFRLRRPHIRVQFGKPFHLPALDREDRSASLQKNTDEIMCRIAAMLPPEYRGAYADHPCLDELLVGQQEPIKI